MPERVSLSGDQIASLKACPRASASRLSRFCILLCRLLATSAATRVSLCLRKGADTHGEHYHPIDYAHLPARPVNIFSLEPTEHRFSRAFQASQIREEGTFSILDGPFFRQVWCCNGVSDSGSSCEAPHRLPAAGADILMASFSVLKINLRVSLPLVVPLKFQPLGADAHDLRPELLIIGLRSFFPLDILSMRDSLLADLTTLSPLVYPPARIVTSRAPSRRLCELKIPFFLGFVVRACVSLFPAPILWQQCQKSSLLRGFINTVPAVCIFCLLFTSFTDSH